MALTCVDFGHLITKKKPDEGDLIEDLVNPNSVRRALKPEDHVHSIRPLQLYPQDVIPQLTL